MNNVVPIKPIRPLDYSAQQIDLIRRTVAADCSKEEFDLFVEAARRIGLDPFRKQIYAVVYNKNSRDKRKMSIITGIDGFRAVAARNGDYRPNEDEPEIVYDDALRDTSTNPLGILKVTATAFKRDQHGDWHPIKAVAYWDEYAPLKEIWAEDQKTGKKKPTGKFELGAMWKRMPRLMISKCAEALAIRKGWPEDLSGVYAPEEMAQSDMIELTASEMSEEYQKEQRLIATKTANSIMIVWRGGDEMEAVPLGAMADRAMAYFSEVEHSRELELWRDRNRVSLQDFWARHKGDALEVKAAMEKRIAELKAAEESQ